MSDAYTTMGFCVAQAASLDTIALRWPHLRREASLQAAKFSIQYRSACEKVESFVRRVAPQAAAKVRDQVEAMVERDAARITAQEGQAFIDLVAQRATGSETAVPSPMFETLHVFGWHDAPALEVTQGHVRSNDTTAELKAKGIRVTLETPISWARVPGRHPNIVWSWVAQNGHGLASLNLRIVREMGPIPTHNELKLLVESGEIAALLEEQGSQVISVVPVSMGPTPGFRANISKQFVRGEFSGNMLMFMERWFFEDAHIDLNCMVLEAKGAPSFDKIRPLCAAISNTMVFPDAWK